MTRHLITLCMLFAFFTCAMPAHSQSKVLTEAAPETAGFSSARLARIDSGMNSWVAQKWVNGSALLIARHGKIVFYKAHGYNDPDTKVPLDKNGIFRIASQTKAITVTAVMMLWEEGKFSLDDPVSKFIPSFANEKVLASFNPKDTTYTTVPAVRPITIRDLLTHTSGLGYPAIGTPAEIELYQKANLTGGVGTKGQTLGDAMDRLGKMPLFFQPGTAWKYGLNMDLLGYLIEKWSGMSLEDFFETRICKPLGMKDTWFNLPADKASRLVNFYQGDSTYAMKKQPSVFGGALDMNYPLQKTNYFSGGGGLVSTLHDYAVLLQMFLNKGEYNGVRILAPNTIRLMTENQIGDLHPNFGEHFEANKFGFGFYIISDEGSKFGPSQAGTYSWGGVFSTTYWVDPKEDMFVIAYEQMWGPYVINTSKALKPLVYGALSE
jgi:CubicO group peptidase (beta-lactamase class C family)